MKLLGAHRRYLAMHALLNPVANRRDHDSWRQLYYLRRNDTEFTSSHHLRIESSDPLMQALVRNGHPAP